MGLFTRKGSKTTSIDTASQPRGSPASSLRSPQSPATTMQSQSQLSFAESAATGRRHSASTTHVTAAPALPKIALPRPPDPKSDPAGYLRSIQAVRERCALVEQRARRNKLRHFEVDMSKFRDTVAFVVSIIKRDFAPDYASIPPHGRWQHFKVGGRDRIAELQASWPADLPATEQCRRILDLFLVSVLLDAGAGNTWSYKSLESGKTYRRSEGLAVASLEMFKSGLFSGDGSQPHQVDARGLAKLTPEALAKGLQVSTSNPITGLDGRTSLLVNLGRALEGNRGVFGDDARPGHMLDYLLSHPSTTRTTGTIVLLPTLWSVLTDDLNSIWPSSRTQIDGVSLGDAWPCQSMPISSTSAAWESIVPFHKLTQWLCYSLMQPMTSIMHIHFAGADLLTGLPEYRNGGLFIDTGVLTLKPEDTQRGLRQFHENCRAEGKRSLEVVPMFAPDDDVVVEWRAVTVGFLDFLLVEVNEKLGLRGGEALSLVQLLEAGSWKGGREMAEISRPNTQCPPIAILSDGTVF